MEITLIVKLYINNIWTTYFIMNSVRLLKEATSSPDWQAHYSAICKLSSGKFQLKFFIDGTKASGYRGILAHGVIFIASFSRIISYPIKNSMATGNGNCIQMHFAIPFRHTIIIFRICDSVSLPSLPGPLSFRSNDPCPSVK